VPARPPLPDPRNIPGELFIVRAQPFA
jgi:hypothetical protein